MENSYLILKTSKQINFKKKKEKKKRNNLVYGILWLSL